MITPLKHVHIPILHLLLIALALFGLFAAGNGVLALFNAAPVGVGSGTSVLITAREPGSSYDAKAFCNDPKTVVVSPNFLVPDIIGKKYTATRGTESVEWTSGINDANPSAKHYWQNAQGVQQSENVEMTREAATCFMKKVK